MLSKFFSIMTLRCISIITVIIFIYLPSDAQADTVYIKPIRLLLPGDVACLGSGSLDSRSEAPDIHKPAVMGAFGNLLSLSYERENLLNEKSSAGNTRIKSYTQSLILIYQPELFGINSSLGVSADSFAGDYELPSYGSPQSVKLEQTNNRRSFAFSIAPGANFLFGAGIDYDNDIDHTFYNLIYLPAEGVGIGFRKYFNSGSFNSSLYSGSNFAENSYLISEYIEEFGVRVGVPEKFTAETGFGKGEKTDYRSMRVKIHPYGRFTIGAIFDEIQFKSRSEISVNENPGGYFSTEAKLDRINVTGDYILSDGSNALFGYEKSTLAANIAGSIDGKYVSSFWENLFSGKRYINGALSSDIRQTHIGITSSEEKRLSWSGGARYIEIIPGGGFNHWTTPPIIPIGKFNEQENILAYGESTFAALFLGTTLRMNRFDIKYGIAQIIPIAVTRKTSDDAEEVTGASQTKDIDISKWQDELARDQGGNLQRIELTWHF